MTIDPLGGRLISLGDLPTLLPRRVHRSTIHRWRTSGVRGVKLQTVVIGGQRYTTREAVLEFVTASTAATDGATPLPSKSRARAIAQAERELDEAGI